MSSTPPVQRPPPSAMWETAFLVCHLNRFPKLYLDVSTDPREIEEIVADPERHQDYAHLACSIINATPGKHYSKGDPSWQGAVENHIKRLHKEGIIPINPITRPIPSLPPSDKIAILYHIIEDHIDHYAAIREAVDALTISTPRKESLRWLPFSKDGQGRLYYHFGTTPRIYREGTTGGRHPKIKWESVTSTMEEMLQLADTLKRSDRMHDKRVSKRITLDILPVVEAAERRQIAKDRARQRAEENQAQVEILGSRTRKRPRVNYSFHLELEDGEDEEYQEGDPEDEDFRSSPSPPSSSSASTRAKRHPSPPGEHIPLHNRRTRAMSRHIDQDQDQDHTEESDVVSDPADAIPDTEEPPITLYGASE